MKINKNNYEAFLLDYIEGNLSAELSVELMLFLENHPELEIDLNDFDIISSNENENITFNDKQKLKRKEFIINDDVIESLIISLVNGDLSKEETDKLLKVIQQDDNYKKMYHQYLSAVVSDENIKLEDKVLLKGHLPITSDNIEYFLIADLENTLNDNERNALINYKNSFPGVTNLESSYAATKLKQDVSIVFANKKSLKKKETVVIAFYSFARYASVAAAACLIIYFSLFSTTANKTNIDFAFASQFTNEDNRAEKLIANQTETNNGNEEKTVEEKEENKKENNPYIAPNNSNPTNYLVNNKKKENKVNPIVKEPVIDFANELPLIENKIEEENPVLYAKEEIKEITNEDNYTLANTNKNLASLNEDDYISPGQYVRNWAKKTFFTEQASEKYTNETTELADNTLQLKGTDLKVQNTKSKDYKEYGFSIGNFSFHRKVKK